MRIIVAEDHKDLLEIIALVVGNINGVTAVFKCSDAGRVLNVLKTDPNIDLVVSDLYMPVMNGIQLTREIRLHFPKVRVCLLTSADEPDVVKEAILAGVDGYVLKNTANAELEEALIRIANGEKFFSAEIVKLLSRLN